MKHLQLTTYRCDCCPGCAFSVCSFIILLCSWQIFEQTTIHEIVSVFNMFITSRDTSWRSATPNQTRGQQNAFQYFNNWMLKINIMLYLKKVFVSINTFNKKSKKNKKMMFLTFFAIFYHFTLLKLYLWSLKFP